MNLTRDRFLEASRTPIEDIQRITYEGQDPLRRMYKEGYEWYMDQVPILDPADSLINEKVSMAKAVTTNLADTLRSATWIGDMKPEKGGFNRTIIALASPTITADGNLKEGPEFVVARWGDQHSSPVHGHATGYIHEEILYGKMRVNTYRMVDTEEPVVRPVETVIATQGTFASLYTRPGKHYFKRETLIHNFTSLGQSATLHYLSEHTRDGRDNKFEVEYFDDVVKLHTDDVEQIDSKQGMYLRKGDVVMVRSTNVPEYGDHYIVVTGPPVMKEHGFRVQDKAIYAPDASLMLDLFEMRHGLTLLKLKKDAKEAFHGFHNIQMVDGEVVFPSTNPLMY